MYHIVFENDDLFNIILNFFLDDFELILNNIELDIIFYNKFIENNRKNITKNNFYKKFITYPLFNTSDRIFNNYRLF